MAQTSTGMSGVDVVLSISNNNSTWTDISGSANSVTVSGFERQSGESYTFDGDTAIVGKGKRAPVEVEINAVYTETAGEAWQLLWAGFDADDGGTYWVKWQHKTGGTTYTSTTGVITSCLPPGGEAAPGEPLMTSMTVRCAEINAT